MSKPVPPTPTSTQESAQGSLHLLTQDTLDSLATAKTNAQYIVTIIDNVLAGESTLASECRDYGFQYNSFRACLRRLSNLSEDKDRFRKMLPHAPTPAEKIYSEVFEVRPEFVYKFMPEDAEDTIECALEMLPEKVAETLRMRSEGMTKVDIGKKLGVTAVTVARFENQGYRLLRHPVRRDLLRYGCSAVKQAKSQVAAEKEAMLEEYKAKLRNSDNEYLFAKNSSDSFSEALLQSPDQIMIKDIGVSVRIQNSCRRCGLTTLEDFRGLTRQGLMSIRGIGTGSCEELIEALKSYGIFIADERDLV